MTMHDLFDTVALALETVGVLAMIVGFIVAFTLAGRQLLKRQDGSFTLLRTMLGGSILLGLEILVAADLVKTITSDPSIENVAVLAIIVLLRTVLSMSIQIEIEGTLPWRRALTTSGATVLSRAVTDEGAR